MEDQRRLTYGVDLQILYSADENRFLLCVLFDERAQKDIVGLEGGASSSSLRGRLAI